MPKDFELSAEEEIRLMAYALWQSEGRPENQSLRHWQQAEAMLREEKDVEDWIIVPEESGQ
jgi:hypothetical protein